MSKTSAGTPAERRADLAALVDPGEPHYCLPVLFTGLCSQEVTAKEAGEVLY